MNMVRYAQNDLPPITEARKAELKALAARPHKTHATVRIDTDIILWLKRQGKGVY